jgi:hypothetical protein
MKVTMLMKRKGERHWRMPAVSAYTAERELQAMLLESPELLPAEEDRRPIAMADEFPVSFGSVDLVGVSAAGWITVVECKLRANSEIKRSIVGQLFAYGAALWEMSYEDFDQRWRQRMDVALIEHVATQAAEHGVDWDRDGFVAAVASNLEAGRFTLVVAVDEITAELRRIIEYLSVHTVGDVAVVALELGYVADGDCQILVPQTYGVELAERKSTSARPRRPWDETTFFAALPVDSSSVAVVRALIAWASEQHLKVVGTTTVSPGLSWRLDAFGTSYLFFTADVRLEQLMLYFGTLRNRPVLKDDARRAALVAALDAIFPIPPERADKYPTIPLAHLADPQTLHLFTEAWGGVVRDIRDAEARRAGGLDNATEVQA